MREAKREFLQKMSHEEALQRAHRMAGILTRTGSADTWRALWNFVCDWDDVHEEMDESSPWICLYELYRDFEGNETDNLTGLQIDDEPYIVAAWLEE